MRQEIAVVTGAASGIGAAVARLLAARGAHVALLDRDAVGLEATSDDLALARTLVLPVDVTDDAAMNEAIHAAHNELGQLTTVVACAGVAVSGDVTAVTPADWDRTFAINAGGVYITARHSVPLLVAGGGGTFTAIASDAGVWGAQRFVAYCASKHAVLGLIKCMALDHGPDGVRSNAVCPGFVETPMAEAIFADTSQCERDFYRMTVPLGRFAEPEEVAAAVGHLSSPDATYANGMTYRLDGGSTAGYFQPPS